MDKSKHLIMKNVVTNLLKVLFISLLLCIPFTLTSISAEALELNNTSFLILTQKEEFCRNETLVFSIKSTSKEKFDAEYWIESLSGYIIKPKKYTESSAKKSFTLKKVIESAVLIKANISMPNSVSLPDYDNRGMLLTKQIDIIDCDYPVKDKLLASSPEDMISNNTSSIIEMYNIKGLEGAVHQDILSENGVMPSDKDIPVSKTIRVSDDNTVYQSSDAIMSAIIPYFIGIVFILAIACEVTKTL